MEEPIRGIIIGNVRARMAQCREYAHLDPPRNYPEYLADRLYNSLRNVVDIRGHPAYLSLTDEEILREFQNTRFPEFPKARHTHIL